MTEHFMRGFLNQERTPDTTVRGSREWASYCRGSDARVFLVWAAFIAVVFGAGFWAGHSH